MKLTPEQRQVLEDLASVKSPGLVASAVRSALFDLDRATAEIEELKRLLRAKEVANQAAGD